MERNVMMGWNKTFGKLLVTRAKGGWWLRDAKLLVVAYCWMRLDVSSRRRATVSFSSLNVLPEVLLHTHFPQPVWLGHLLYFWTLTMII